MTGGDRPGVTRRRLLAGLGTVGVAGGLAGSGTAAVLSDRTAIGQSVGAGALELSVDWEVLAGPDAGRSGTAGGAVPGPIRVDGPAAAGTALFRVSLASGESRGRLWIATGCPTPGDSPIARALDVDLRPVEPNTGRPVGPALASGSLAEVAAALAGGRQLAAGEGDEAGNGCRSGDRPVGLRLRWAVDGFVGSAETRLTLAFAAVQCRHVAAANPFDPTGGCES